MSARVRRPIQPSSPVFPAELFGAPRDLPEDFRYQAELLTDEASAALARELGALPFKPFEFHGFQANRHVVGFGYRYDYGSRQAVDVASTLGCLEPPRREIVTPFGRPAEAFAQVLINEYRPGAGIGWRRDKAHFAEVVGMSLLAPCTLRFRRRSGGSWDRASLSVTPCSAYLLSGPSRMIRGHSIPPLDRHRYPITYRTLVGGRK
jgi:alkylated DNA repair dioxygenase AlkB